GRMVGPHHPDRVRAVVFSLTQCGDRNSTTVRTRLQRNRSRNLQDFVDHLVPDPVIAEEFHVSLMTLWRWDRNPARIKAGWPPRIKIGQRNYRHRSQIDAFKAALLQRALSERDGG